MKVVILAGGFGTRISEKSHLIPKPMIEIESMPIIWHIMKIYSHFGFNDFIICAGYKQNIIKEWFSNYFIYNSDVTFDFSNNNSVTVHRQSAEPWRVTVVDTGLNTMTGGRIKRIEKYVGNETFMMTYGDGVADVNIPELLNHHRAKGLSATITAYQPSNRYGVLDIGESDEIHAFSEKPKENCEWINAGFMVLEPAVFNHIEGDEVIFERYPLEKCASMRQLSAYKHTGFWQCMDTIRDMQLLESYIKAGDAPWMVWQKNKE